MTRYVCGFAFTFEDTGPSVLLIRKARPEWQRGRLNGIGGHIEPGETPVQSMRREAREEAGDCTDRWIPFAVLAGDDWEVYFFRGVICDNPFTGNDDEPLEVVNVHDLPDMVLPNLHWLIPLALNPNRDEEPYRIEICALAQLEEDTK